MVRKTEKPVKKMQEGVSEAKKKDFKWLHFSDLHLSSKNFDSERAKEKLIEFLKSERKQGNLEFDYVFVTGDIANKGDYTTVKVFMLELWEALELDMKELSSKVYWAVGNHDIKRDVKSNRHEDIISIRKKKKTLDEDLDSDGYDLLVKAGMEPYFKNLSDIFATTITDEQKKDLYILYKLENLNLIVLNTCVTSTDDSDPQNLHISFKKLNKVLNQAEKSNPIFVLGHHGRDFFCFNDMNELGQVFDDKGVDAYFCGHNHRLGFATFSDTQNDIYQFTCGGGAEFEDGSVFSFMHGKYSSVNNTIQIIPYSYREKGDRNWSQDEHLHRKLKANTTFILPRLAKQIAGEEASPEDYIKILHLSDLQFGITAGQDSGKNKAAIEYRKRVIETELIEHLTKKLPEKWKPDIVVISGDLAWNAKKEDYEKLAKWLKDLLYKLDISIDNVIVCSGNHDINTNAAVNNFEHTKEEETHARKRYNGTNFESEKTKYHKYEQLISDSLKKRAGKELTDEAFADEKAVYKNFAEFIAFCKGEIDHDIKIKPLTNRINCNLDVQYLYGFRDVMGIRFNVFNSSWYCVDRKSQKDSSRDKERLFIGELFVDDVVNNYVSNNSFSVTVFHHPFEWLNPTEGDDDAKVRQSILKLSDIILCGHVHTKVGEPTFSHNQAQIFQSGALWDQNEYTYETRIIRINKRSGVINQHVLEYDTKHSSWSSRDGEGPNQETGGYPVHFPKHYGLFASGIKEIDQ